jgi:hypothetical protein
LAEALAWNSMSLVAGTHHIGVTVASLEKALAFWGKRVVYLRIHDGVTLEIFQPAQPEPAPR